MKGNLVWKDGPGSEVIFNEDPEGKVEMHPYPHDSIFNAARYGGIDVAYDSNLKYDFVKTVKYTFMDRFIHKYQPKGKTKCKRWKLK